MNTSSTGGTQAVARAAALLREIATSGGGGGSLADLASRLDLERPTAYRILQRLVLEGLAEQDPATRSYALGPLLYELGLAAKPPRLLHGLANAALVVLARESGDTAFAMVQSGMDSLCIDRQEGSYPVKALMMDPGRRRPMGTGSGSLAMLGAMPLDKAQRILEANALRLQHSGEATPLELEQVIAQARTDGFVVRAPHDAPEILSIGLAVCNAYGTPVLALSISALRFRIEQRQDQLLRLLRQSQGELEKSLRSATAGPAA